MAWVFCSYFILNSNVWTQLPCRRHWTTIFSTVNQRRHNKQTCRNKSEKSKKKKLRVILCFVSEAGTIGCIDSFKRIVTPTCYLFSVCRTRYVLNKNNVAGIDVLCRKRSGEQHYSGSFPSVLSICANFSRSFNK